QVRKGLEAARRFLDPPLGPDAQPVEVRAAVVDAIERKVAILGVGRAAFPYDRVTVRVAVRPGADRRAFEAVFTGLDDKVRDRLRERRCEIPPRLETGVVLLKKQPSDWPPERWFTIECHAADDGRSQSSSASGPLLKVTVVNGVTDRKSYAFREGTILVG